MKSLLTGKSTDVFSDTMHLDALTENLVKGKLDRNAQYIKKLQSEEKQNKQSIKKIRKILKAAKTNPTRFNNLVAAGNTSNSPVNHSKEGKQYIEKQAIAKLKQHNATQKALLEAKNTRSQIVAGHDTYKKVQKTGGVIGRVLSLWDAGQNSYYYDTETKETRFDTGTYLKNAAMNLSGLSGFVNAYQEGQKKGVLVGVYNGAKCIPLASDALNVYELTESSIGIVHDTLESKRIIAENKDEQERQGQVAVSKLKTLFSQIKAKEAEFRRLQQESEEKIKNFDNITKQYTEVFNRSVAREQSLISADSLLEAADKARSFMDAERITTLRDDSEKMMLATATTIKLASTTLEHYQTNGGDPENLDKTIEELKQMVSVLTARKNECDVISSALSPLLGGGKALEGASEQNQQMAADSLIANELYQKGANQLKEHGNIIKRGKTLKIEQDTILAQSKQLLSYFYRNGDPKTKSDLEIAFRNVLQYKIDDYSLSKLDEKQDTISFEFSTWRKSTSITEEIPPDFAIFIQNATSLGSEIAGLGDSLGRSISTTQDFLERLSNPTVLTSDTSPATEKTNQQYLKDEKLFNLSIDDITKQIQFRERGGAIREHAELYCGYQAYKYSETGRLVFGSANKDLCAKELETGIITIVDRSYGKKKNVKYTIWYVKDVITVRGSWVDYYRKKMKLQETIENEIEDYNVQPIKIKNAHDAYIGKLKNPLHNEVRGFAFNFPFYMELDGWVDCIVGENGRFSTGSKDPYNPNLWDNYFGDSPQEKTKLQERMKYWDSRLNSEIADNLDAHMTIPAQMVAFTDKNFLKDVRPLFRGLDGFKGDAKIHLSHEREYRTLKKRWEWGNNIHASITASVNISAEFPDSNESWGSAIQKMHKRLQENKEQYDNKGRIKKLNLPGTDLAYGYSETDSRPLQRGGRSIQAPTQVGNVIFIKKNVRVSIQVYASNIPPNERIDIFGIAQTIISNF
ncbi:hypothetical protein [Desulfocapsa sulfexigens]|uniref:hypothetical protein n=1 Tax=Desulfocapsa sulfexigens TaxID=65555 RepID=UPI0012946739|nr:hypothetical protein [Desulfocapsa sulfexigens]